MEAIDEFANENIVRSIAFTALEKISTGQYQELLPIASQSLRQRARFLQENWYQWQKDTSLRVIEELVSLPDFTDHLYQRPVYYNRMDADTLYAIVEFAERDTQHFVVILLLEEGNSDISDIKYHNTKEMTEQEWLDVFENWSRSLEEAERIYLTKVARPKKVLASETHSKNTPDDYWGEWSSDEEGQGQSEDVAEQEKEKESEDSEDEYYTRWSKDPGTLTPGPEKSLKVINQQEIEEEYDQSYNPLFTVPSVPNLMDAHTAALSELTQILQTSLPQQQQQQQQQAKIEKFPGAYPESGVQTPFVEQTRYYQEAGRQLFMKSLSALIGAAKLLGYEGKDILEMVKEIVNKD